MKKKKEIWVEVCDFCGEEKTGVCDLCGKDLCNLHWLSLERSYVAGETSGLYIGGKIVVNKFCPDHLSLELTEHYQKSLLKLEKERKKK